jgi:GNAT superfamily N-acetyltransferase
MSITLREAEPADAERAGHICYEAFRAINEAHGFAPDIPSPEAGVSVLAGMIRRPGIHVVIAEQDGEIVGSNGLDERSEIAGVGPITVDPNVQNAGIGRLLMHHVMERGARFAGIRLVQAAFHCRSLSLYTKLGFDPVEPLSCVQGRALSRALPGAEVRPATAADQASCDDVCRAVHGHARGGELADAIADRHARVVVRDGRITGYATFVGFFGHAVGLADEDVMALIAAAPAFLGPGFLVPTRNARLLRWCLEQKLRIEQPLTLMATGQYREPRGAYLPSILY